jgi:hypothetical protein
MLFKETNMKSDERSIAKILDDGAPFVIWEKERKYKKCCLNK